MILVRCFIKQNCNWGPMPLIYLAVRSAGALCPGSQSFIHKAKKKKKKKLLGGGGGGGGGEGPVLDCYIRILSRPCWPCLK